MTSVYTFWANYLFTWLISETNILNTTKICSICLLSQACLNSVVYTCHNQFSVYVKFLRAYFTVLKHSTIPVWIMRLLWYATQHHTIFKLQTTYYHLPYTAPETKLSLYRAFTILLYSSLNNSFLLLKSSITLHIFKVIKWMDLLLFLEMTS